MALFGNDESLEVVLKLRDEFTAGLKKAEAGVSSFKNNMDSSIKASNTFAMALGGAAAGIGLVASAGIKTAGELETMRQGFVTLLGSAEKADETMRRIKKEAAATPFELPGLTSATQALALVTKDGNKSIDVLLNVGKALSAAGKGQVELDRIISNLQQIALTGKITEMDIRQFGMNGVNVLEILADHYGVTTAAAGEMVKTSKDAFGDLAAAFEKAGGAGGRFERAFIDQAGTFTQLMSNMKDSMNIFLADFVTQTGIFDAVKAALGGFVQFLSSNSDSIVAFVRDFGNWMKENQPVAIALAGAIVGALVPALIGLAFALGSVLVPLLPFMAAGALIAGVLALTGGFRGLLELIESRTGFVTLFGWAWKNIADTFNTTLKPALMGLWDAMQPMIPILQLVGKILGVVLVAAVWAVVGALTGLIQLVTIIIALGVEFYNTIANLFTAPITAFMNAVKDAYSWLSKLVSKMGDAGIKDLGKKALGGIKDFLGFEHGGTVPGPRGTAVPIMAHGQEQIIPAGSTGRGGGGDSYSVVINNPVISRREDADYLRIQIEQALRDVTRGHKLSTI